MDNTWEDFISLENRTDLGPEVLQSASYYRDQRDGSVVWNEARLSIDLAMERDTYPLPTEAHRELYYGQNHYNYWASGLRDWFQVKEWADANGAILNSVLDVGCASGRTVRHIALQTDVAEVYGCDINRLHVDWVLKNLPDRIRVFQNTSIPHLPLGAASLDLITAFSVFTHVESFDTTWLMEFRRVLRPGGVAWLTVHGDRTWRELKPTWPLYAALDTHAEYQSVRNMPEIPKDRMVFRWKSDRSYSANIFYRDEYIRKTWGRFFEFVDIIPARPEFQDIVILRRKAD